MTSLTRESKERGGVLALLLLGLCLMVVLMYCIGCTSATVTTPPPPTLTYIGVQLSWKNPPGPYQLIDCNATQSPLPPCLQYVLTGPQGFIAKVPITSTSYLVTPAPATWPATYTLTMEILAFDGTITPTVNPAVTAVQVGTVAQ